MGNVRGEAYSNHIKLRPRLRRLSTENTVYFALWNSPLPRGRRRPMRNLRSIYLTVNPGEVKLPDFVMRCWWWWWFDV
jgi:hypothetical protein